jgi:phosphohistidine phosphatase SixA
MLAGHEPDFSRVVRSFTGGRVKFPKAALAAIEIGDEPARLLFLFPAKVLVRFAP